MADAAHVRHLDRPIYHVMPESGWMNDPNGPIFYQGRFHMFYQHLTTGCEWDWGIVWGHASSRDLVTWVHHPLALKPSPGGLDADGCFSGCCVEDEQGVPTILYTGARLRSNLECGDTPPEDQDLQLPFFESQLAAIPNSDQQLGSWEKLPEPILALPPPGLALTGWRDPFIYERGDHTRSWVMLLGSGIKGKGGTVLVYTAQSLFSGWELDGCLCSGDADTGAMWECPLLAQLNPHVGESESLQSFEETETSSVGNHTTSGSSTVLAEPSSQSQEPSAESGPMPYFFCVSPDAPTNPVICWIGGYDNKRFLLSDAQGPFRLDLGDVLYAPNLMKDHKGRILLWGWLQEHRTTGAYEYAGCLSVPRILSAKNGKLFQEPCPEINRLRTNNSWSETRVDVFPENPIALQGVRGAALDLEIVLERGLSDAAGVVIHSWNITGEGGAVIVFDWERHKLEVIFEVIDQDTMQFCIDRDTSRRIGGIVNFSAGDDLHLRILLDHSSLEIFTGSGEVLSTRLCRGHPPHGADAGVEFVAFGGNAHMRKMIAWEMGTIWNQQ